MARHWFQKPKAILLTSFLLLLLLAVACGTAEEASTPEAGQTPGPVATIQPGTTPVAPPEATSAPTPAAPNVNPGKVTLLVGDFGTERFDTNYGTTGKDIRKTFHGHPAILIMAAYPCYRHIE